ncbi:MAG: Transposase [Candidatus Alkanophagales archaeon MCA70_species_2]|nr:Transposase [Candidatus Alkanophaga liquidiphilum]
MHGVRGIVEELKVFERNKVPPPFELRSGATYIQTSSVRRTARNLSELHPVSKTSVRNWIKKRNLKRSYRLQQRKKEI